MAVPFSRVILIFQIRIRWQMLFSKLQQMSLYFFIIFFAFIIGTWLFHFLKSFSFLTHLQFWQVSLRFFVILFHFDNWHSASATFIFPNHFLFKSNVIFNFTWVRHINLKQILTINTGHMSLKKWQKNVLIIFFHGKVVVLKIDTT